MHFFRWIYLWRTVISVTPPCCFQSEISRQCISELFRSFLSPSQQHYSSFISFSLLVDLTLAENTMQNTANNTQRGNLERLHDKKKRKEQQKDQWRNTLLSTNIHKRTTCTLNHCYTYSHLSTALWRHDSDYCFNNRTDTTGPQDLLY